MQADEEYRTERLDHLGIVAGVCREIGLVEWLDREAGERRNLVSIGSTFQTRLLRLQPLHHKILHLLGPAYEQFYFLSH